MAGVYETHFRDPEMRVCRECPLRGDCAIFDCCQHVLESVTAGDCPAEARSLERALRTRISELGYAFPFGKQRCRLSERPTEARRLVEESLAILQVGLRPGNSGR